jgi:hypothetical protein
MACDTDFAMYYSVFTDIRIGFNMSEKWISLHIYSSYLISK